MKNIYSTKSGFILVLFVCSFGRGSEAQEPDGKLWQVAGQNLRNTRGSQDTRITSGNAGSLHTKWVLTTEADVSATPTVADDAIYFPDWAGNLYAVDRTNGQPIWSHSIADYDHFPGALAR